MISIAIPYHGDRSQWTMKTIINCHKLSYVNEIVVCIEPGSDAVRLIRECALMRKVKLIFNFTRLFVFYNKVKAVENCKNEWVALIDSDNVINAAYLGAFLKESKNPNTIYHPSVAQPRMNFEEFIGIDIGYKYAAERLGEENFNKFFNNMNYIVHRQTWLRNLNDTIMSGYDPLTADSAFINYQCLKGGMVIKALFGMVYIHNVHGGSTYLQNQGDGVREYRKLMKEMKESIYPGRIVEIPETLNWSGFGESKRLPAAKTTEGLITD